MSEIEKVLDHRTLKARVEEVCREVEAATRPAIMEAAAKYEARVLKSQLV